MKLKVKENYELIRSETKASSVVLRHDLWFVLDEDVHFPGNRHAITISRAGVLWCPSRTTLFLQVEELLACLHNLLFLFITRQVTYLLPRTLRTIKLISKIHLSQVWAFLYLGDCLKNDVLNGWLLINQEFIFSEYRMFLIKHPAPVLISQGLNQTSAIR